LAGIETELIKNQ